MARRVVQALRKLVDAILVIMLCLPFTMGCYALWDSHVTYERAEVDLWRPYKPTEPEPLSFWELQRINPEVRAWVTVYGTGVDYPICQSSPDDISKYLTYDAKGEYSLSGSLFIDEKNAGDFSDFSTIVYGHHMENGVMFGSLTDYDDPEFFEEHRFGNLFVNDDDYGLDFFCYLDADAYDANIYRTIFATAESRQEYLNLLHKQAKHWREGTEVCESNRIVLLSTCSSESTNGRAILVGKICGEKFKNPFVKIPNFGTGVDSVDDWLDVLGQRWVVILLVLMVVLLTLIVGNKIRQKTKQKAK